MKKILLATAMALTVLMSGPTWPEAVDGEFIVVMEVTEQDGKTRRYNEDIWTGHPNFNQPRDFAFHRQMVRLCELVHGGARCRVDGYIELDTASADAAEGTAGAGLANQMKY